MPRKAAPVAERIQQSIAPEGECWRWTKHLNNRGYGVMGVRDKMRLAHRESYLAFVGAIPPGLELDHLCRNTWCVNPTHLEPVTHRDNCLRGRGASAINAAKTECPHGHRLDGLSRGVRYCKQCNREHVAKAYYKTLLSGNCWLCKRKRGTRGTKTMCRPCADTHRRQTRDQRATKP